VSPEVSNMIGEVGTLALTDNNQMVSVERDGNRIIVYVENDLWINSSILIEYTKETDLGGSMLSSDIVDIYEEDGRLYGDISSEYSVIGDVSMVAYAIDSNDILIPVRVIANTSNKVEFGLGVAIGNRVKVQFMKEVK
jgi:hypothetical protein